MKAQFLFTILLVILSFFLGKRSEGRHFCDANLYDLIDDAGITHIEHVEMEENGDLYIADLHGVYYYDGNKLILVETWEMD